MAVGINAWAIDSPVLTNTDKVLLSTYEIVGGEIEIMFESDLITSKYGRYLIEWVDVIGSITVGYDINLSIGGVWNVDAGAYKMWSISDGFLGSNAFWRLKSILSTDTKRPARGVLELDLGDFANSIRPTVSYESASYTAGTTIFPETGRGNFETLGVIDGIKFLRSISGSGSFTSGSFNLYGVPNV